ncbi:MULTISPECIES: GerMN domain-containing protein [Halanaerobium]|uniref:Sporulation and spore germination n=1 Tax=Halanaerobium kushneri TaxID=56779 RepID=A0A1N6U4S6_9FIRM|nr:MULTISPECIES: GerMN domain-containing protein [Halanaerobium]RCW60193.1 sporulation and spore germination protein [Halanaerobium sp. ST460_2HS_T2]SIQ60593.1 Sporulation and spore germination [Halanaerobium kushneri]
MAVKKIKLSPEQKRKMLLVLRVLLLTAAVLYLLFLFYNNYFLDDKIKVYFSTENANYLKSEKRTINQESDLYFQIFDELKSGPESSGLTATIPAGSQLLDYQIEDKMIILNFNQAFRDNHWGGSTGELLTIYSIVNSYTSLEEIQTVRILIEGKEVESLVGHLDLTQPLMYNQKLTEGS